MTHPVRYQYVDEQGTLVYDREKNRFIPVSDEENRNTREMLAWTDQGNTIAAYEAPDLPGEDTAMTLQSRIRALEDYVLLKELGL